MEKKKGKGYADQKRMAKECDLELGDIVKKYAQGLEIKH